MCLLAVLFLLFLLVLFFFNATATTEIYTLSLHDALPISCVFSTVALTMAVPRFRPWICPEGLFTARIVGSRSEEHTSELQSLTNLVCRLLLEKKKKKT